MTEPVTPEQRAEWRGLLNDPGVQHLLPPNWKDRLVAAVERLETALAEAQEQIAELVAGALPDQSLAKYAIDTAHEAEVAAKAALAEAERERATHQAQMIAARDGMTVVTKRADELEARAEQAERQVREVEELVNDLTKETAILLRNPPEDEDYAEFVVKRCNRLALIRDRLRAALFGVSGPTTGGCGCGHDWERHGPEAGGCVECRCITPGPTTPLEEVEPSPPYTCRCCRPTTEGASE